MAQLNPNFEIDYDDINSYEQIQLINDTQLAKENLLMHRAYKEPSDDAIIKNHFSSFTFVDFCPKIFPTSRQSKVSKNISKADLQEHLNDINDSSPQNAPGGVTLRHYELETFSQLFERINVWLKSNKDWRVVSMETLVYDCRTSFNYTKSSIHANYLPRNTRGLRLYLSPSKSRFSGPQKIGCINVVPRKISGSYYRHSADSATGKLRGKPVEYETLDDILTRLNELLLTRPIEGRILSVETITLPMIDGYADTESNYFMDTSLNKINESIYTLNNNNNGYGFNNNSNYANSRSTSMRQMKNDPYFGARDGSYRTLVDILRVYYEFGPMICGLVNLIDFNPRFYLPVAPVSATSKTARPLPNTQQPQQASSSSPTNSAAGIDSQSLNSAPDSLSKPLANTTDQQGNTDSHAGRTNCDSPPARQPTVKIPATESLTRLIRRSLDWFQAERKQVLIETGPKPNPADKSKSPLAGDDDQAGSSEVTEKYEASINKPFTVSRSRSVNLKLCNVQVCGKFMLKYQLVPMKESNAFQSIDTRQMVHKPVDATIGTIVCDQCPSSHTMSTAEPKTDWCTHLIDLTQLFELKFVRLAYIVPVFNSYTARSLCSIARPLSSANASENADAETSAEAEPKRSSRASSVRSGEKNAALVSQSPSSSWRSQQQAGGGSKVNEDSSESSSEDDEEDEEDDGQDEDEEDDSTSDDEEDENDDEVDEEEIGSSRLVKELLRADGEAEEWAKQVALSIVIGTNERHARHELNYHLTGGSDDTSCCTTGDTPIGQLSYRLFAPCQLVNSSSCFAINPVNSSSPLSRRGSVDLNGSGLSSENAHPATSLLGSTGELTSARHHYHQSQAFTFGTVLPAFIQSELMTESSSMGPRHSIDGSLRLPPDQQAALLTRSASNAPAIAGTSAMASSSANNDKYTTNEFESVEAIRRRMEVYVTTNSMKVVACETLVVNLSDALACLSTAIEQTVVRANFVIGQQRAPSTFVSVYILYAAVDEPQLPSQLLEQQRIRNLELISEEINENDKEPVFDDDFNGTLATVNKGPASAGEADSTKQQPPTAPESSSGSAATTTKRSQVSTSRRASKEYQSNQSGHQNESNMDEGQTGESETTGKAEHQKGDPPEDSSLTVYNCAYDRTVALPSPPENYLGGNCLDPVEMLDFELDSLWLREGDELGLDSNISNKLAALAARGNVRGKRGAGKGLKRRHRHRNNTDSQCSMM